MEAYEAKKSSHDRARARSPALIQGSRLSTSDVASPHRFFGTARLWSGIARITTTASAVSSPRQPSKVRSLGCSENITIMLAG